MREIVDSFRLALEESHLSRSELCVLFSQIEGIKSELLSQSHEGEAEGVSLEDIRQTLMHRMRNDISGLAPDESTIYPYNSDFSKGPERTKTVDAFFIDDDELDHMVQQGIVQKYICSDCGSKSIEEIDIISHSFSRDELDDMFRLIPGDLSHQTLVDIGSRLGVVLYKGYIDSNIKRLIGIELNPFFHSLQEDMIRQYGMQDRIELVHANVLDCSDVVRQASIVVLHNVFEFFASKAQMEQYWNVIRSSVRKNALIISSPSLESLFERSALDWDPKWLEKVNESCEGNIVMYRVRALK